MSKFTFAAIALALSTAVFFGFSNKEGDPAAARAQNDFIFIKLAAINSSSGNGDYTLTNTSSSQANTMTWVESFNRGFSTVTGTASTTTNVRDFEKVTLKANKDYIMTWSHRSIDDTGTIKTEDGGTRMKILLNGSSTANGAEDQTWSLCNGHALTNSSGDGQGGNLVIAVGGTAIDVSFEVQISPEAVSNNTHDLVQNDFTGVMIQEL